MTAILPKDRSPSDSDLQQQLRAMLKRPYSLTAAAESTRFTPIDLEPFVNRSFHFRKGWLGDRPLPHLHAGTHLIHGIPFHILGGTTRKDRGAIIFRSTTNETGSAQALPSRLKIPVGTHARSIYVLHGCGYARYLSPFAAYDFYSGKKHLGSVPLIALGRPPAGDESIPTAPDLQKANVQDWWPDFLHMDFLHARRAPIVEHDDENILHHHAYLYTLEWVNPFPKLKISHVVITADANQSTTLGVLAISALKKAP